MLRGQRALSLLSLFFPFSPFTATNLLSADDTKGRSECRDLWSRRRRQQEDGVPSANMWHLLEVPVGRLFGFNKVLRQGVIASSSISRAKKEKRKEGEKEVDLWSKFFSANFQSAGGRGSRAGSCRLFQTRRSGHLLPSGVLPPPSVLADLNLGPAALCNPPPPTPPPALQATTQLRQSEDFHSAGTRVCPSELLLVSSRSILCVLCCTHVQIELLIKKYHVRVFFILFVFLMGRKSLFERNKHDVCTLGKSVARRAAELLSADGWADGGGEIRKIKRTEEMNAVTAVSAIISNRAIGCVA